MWRSVSSASSNRTKAYDHAVSRDAPSEAPTAAGDFAVWLTDAAAVVRGETAADVPCAGCTACCRAAQFVHIEPDERDTLAHIPSALLFPAPQRPRGHMVMGYDERGHCPMLVDDRCSIYEHRPRTCRAYDCRMLAATGVEVDDNTGDLAARVRRWRFSFAHEEDLHNHEALREIARALPQRNPIDRAAAAIALATGGTAP
jgi:Fe-S-cluster containining protein